MTSLLFLFSSAKLFSEPPPPESWESDIQAFESTDRAQPPPRGAVLFVGSSSIRLWATLAQDFPEVDVINRGFGGSEIADSTHFADRIVVPYRPRQIVLYAGDNDLMNGKSPAQVAAAFEAFVARVRRDLPGVRIAFIAIKPSPARAHLLDGARAANERIRRIADADPRIDYIDVFTPMLDADGRPRDELFVDDRLHLNAAGYALWRSRVAPFLVEDGAAGAAPY